MIGANLELARPSTAGGAREAIDRASDAVQLGAIALRKYQVLAGGTDAAKPDALVLGDEIRRAVDLLRRTSGSTIDVLLDKDLWPVRISAEDVETALFALSRDFFDAFPRHGRLSITASNVRDDGSPNAIGEAVRIDARDQAVALSTELLARAKESLFTTRSPGRGAELGLTILLGLVERAGGRVDIRSEAGPGTTVSLLLPRAVEHSAAAGAAEQLPLGDGELVLIVAPDAKAGERMAGLVEGLGYAAFVAQIRSGAEKFDAGELRPAIFLLADAEAAAPATSETAAVTVRLPLAVSRAELAAALSEAIGRSGAPRGDTPLP
jgi:hypothetical protein